MALARLALAAVAVSLFAPAAWAQPERVPVEPGVALGVRVGLAIPLGELGAVTSDGISVSLADAVGRMAPLGLDVGYRITPHLQAGAFLQYAFGAGNPTKAPRCSDCSIRATTFGATVRYHTDPGSTFDPWLGVGLGYELVRFRGSATDALDGRPVTVTREVRGLQFCLVEAGGDLPFGRSLTIGPFVNFGLGSYGRWSETQHGVTEEHEFKTELMHEWFGFGLRAQYRF